MSKPSELLFFEFLEAAKADAASFSFLSDDEKDLLSGMTIHDTIYQNITTGQDYGVRLGETPSAFAPGREDDFKEWDAEVPLAVFARVEGTDKTERAASLQKVFSLQVIIEKLCEDQTLGERICNSYLLRWMRGFDEMDGEPFAVANTSLIVNPTGAINFQRQS